MSRDKFFGDSKVTCFIQITIFGKKYLIVDLTYTQSQCCNLLRALIAKFKIIRICSLSVSTDKLRKFTLSLYKPKIIILYTRILYVRNLM